MTTETTTAERPAATLYVDARLFAAVALFRAKDDIRYYLQAVHVQPSPLGTGVLISATDGKQLATAFDVHGEADKEVLINVSPAFIAAARKVGAGGQVRLIDGKAYVFDEHGLETFIQAGSPLMEGKFPQFARILPGSHEAWQPGMQEPVNPQLLARICQAAKVLSRKRATPLVHRSYGSHRPVITSIEGTPELIVGTMGMRLDSDTPVISTALQGVIDHAKATLSNEPALDGVFGDADSGAEG